MNKSYRLGEILNMKPMGSNRVRQSLPYQGKNTLSEAPN